MKKIISILLVFAMLAGVASISVTAQEAEDYSVYPESEHDYENDCWKTWKYVHPEEAEGLFVTFSADTYFEPETEDDGTGNYKSGDSVHIYAICEDSHLYIGSFQGDMLASKTMYIPSSSFFIDFHSDSSVTAYGFKIERIHKSLPENVNAICYNFEPTESGIDKFFDCFAEGEAVVAADNMPLWLFNEISYRNGCEYRCGWATSPDGGLVYDDGAEITSDEPVLNLYCAWTPLLVSSDEVFSFYNNEYSFSVDKGPLGLFPKGEYYMTPEDHDMLLRNARRLGLPGLISYKALKEYPQRPFQGACFGMTCTAFLQYHGVIDMLTLQEGAKTLHDLKATPEVISVIDYYQSLTILSFLCQNQAPHPGSDEYKKELKALYETVSGGTPVLMSIPGDNYIFGTNHSTLVTGTYTDTEGNHYLLAYGGSGSYAESSIAKYPISSDFSSFCNGSTFYWTDDYSHLEAFDMDGDGSPVKWYMEFIPHIFSLLKMLVRYLPVLLGK